MGSYGLVQKQTAPGIGLSKQGSTARLGSCFHPVNILMKIAVLNPDGNDPEQHFPECAGVPQEKVHPPVNFHAFAACTSGSFHRKPGSIPSDVRSVLLLLRADLKRCFYVLEELKAAGKIVAVTWKETGAHQIAKQLNDASNLEWFFKICASAHGAMATTTETVSLYRSAGAQNVQYIPTPYPVERPDWDFSIPIAKRRGVLIGTREFEVPSRNHLAALMTAKLFREPVTVFNFDGRSGRKILEAIGLEQLEIIEKPLGYLDYLRVMARHRIVWQLDSSCVPGQVAGDATLCRIPCIGGHGAVDREAFPTLTGQGREISDLMGIADQLLHDSRAYESEVKVDASIARERISFSLMTERLLHFFKGIER